MIPSCVYVMMLAFSITQLLYYQSFVERYAKHLVLGRGRKLCSAGTEALLQVMSLC